MTRVLKQLSWFIHTFLLRMGGYDPKEARKHPFHYQIRMAGYGLAVIIGGFLAFFAGWHTAYSISHSMAVGLFFGLIWSVLITALDYQILVYINRRNSKWVGRLRFLTSLVMSVLISTPLILLSCRGPIMELLAKQKQDQLAIIDRDFAAAQKQQIDQPLAENQARLHEMEQAYLREADGTGGSGRRGIGPWTRLKKAAFDSSKADFLQYQKTMEIQRGRMTKVYKDKRTAIEENFATDELAQIKALFRLLNDPAVLFRWLLLMIALILLEMSPLLLKLSNMNSPDPYGKSLADWQKVEDIRTQSKTETEILDIRLGGNRHKEALIGKHKKARSTEWVNHVLEQADIKSTGIIKITEQYAAARQQMEPWNDADKEEAAKILHSMKQEDLKKIQTDQPDIPDPIFNTFGQNTGEPNPNPVSSIAPPFYTCIATNISDEHPFRLNAQMVDKAIELCAGANSQKEKVRNLYEWLHYTFPYDSNHDDFKKGYRTAEDVWHDKTGVCGEVTALFVAMARCVGLEAYYASVRKDEHGEKINHACAEVRYSNGDRQLVDISYHQLQAAHRDCEVLSDAEVARLFGSWRRYVAA